jgi:membrane protein YqaA with SNARE-associated domain
MLISVLLLLTILLSSVGALLGAGLVYSLPAYLYLFVMRQRSKEGQKISLPKVANLHLIVLFGIIMTITGTTLTVKDIMK